MQEPVAASAAAPPRHVAIIMDGNGRWASQRGLPRVMGHRKGAEAVRAAVEGCAEMGVSYLTLYAFSSENWRRPAGEISDLMDLLRLFIRREINVLDKNGIRLKVIGDRAPLATDITDLIEKAEIKTAVNKGLTLVIALNYGARQEILRAAQKLAEKAIREGRDLLSASEEDFESQLYTAGIPDPDLLIRTSGEQRLSNFLLWQSAYAELVFLDLLWPDFTKDALAEAFKIYGQRERRFGGI